jgi:Family of unknown function (DUF6384)
MADMSLTATPGEASGPVGPAAKLDELMLAMDVVDTLRHQEGLVERELGQSERDAALKARLRELYEGQGLEVSDRILDEGLRALKESRFAYTPPLPSFGRTMAVLWVRRATIAKIAAVVLVLTAGVAGWQIWKGRAARQASEQARIELTTTLPQQLSAAVEATRGEAGVAAARQAVDQLSADGQAALAAGNSAGVKTVLAALADLRAKLERQYILRIVSRPGEPSGVFRIPDINQNSRNYYLIVEAVTPDGKVLSMPIVNEENGKAEAVTKWGVRVPQSTFAAVQADKQDDGIIQKNRLGEKRRGALDPEYSMPVQGGMITKW